MLTVLTLFLVLSAMKITVNLFGHRTWIRTTVGRPHFFAKVTEKIKPFFEQPLVRSNHHLVDMKTMRTLIEWVD